MTVKMIKTLENKMEKIQESINKDLEELKNKDAETNNTVTEFFFRQFAYFLFIYLDFCVASLFLHLCSISLPFHYFFFLTYCV